MLSWCNRIEVCWRMASCLHHRIYSCNQIKDNVQVRKKKPLTCWGRFVSQWAGLLRAQGPRMAHSGPPPPPPHVRSVHYCVYWSYIVDQCGTKRKETNNQRSMMLNWFSSEIIYILYEVTREGGKGQPQRSTLVAHRT